MRIVHYPQSVAEWFESSVPHIMISITTPPLQANLLQGGNRKGLLRLQFHDLDKQLNIPNAEALILFNSSHAKKIYDFVCEHLHEIDLIIVHCEAGISRSAGVAAALSKWLIGEDWDFFKKAIPNRRVYSVLLREIDRRNNNVV